MAELKYKEISEKITGAAMKVCTWIAEPKMYRLFFLKSIYPIKVQAI